MFGTRKLGRTSDQRKAMLRAMTTYLLENGKMETTFTRAKEVQPVVEKMITLGKKKGLANYRKALSYITKEDVAHKLFEENRGGSFLRWKRADLWCRIEKRDRRHTVWLKTGKRKISRSSYGG